MTADSHQKPPTPSMAATTIQFQAPGLVPLEFTSMLGAVPAASTTPFVAPQLPDSAFRTVREPAPALSDASHPADPSAAAPVRTDVTPAARPRSLGRAAGLDGDQARHVPVQMALMPDPGRPPREAIVLRTHQAEALEAVDKELAVNPRATIVLPPGSGKSILAAAVAERIAPGGSVLIVVPTLHLISQTAAAWARYGGPDATAQLVGVCGNKRVLRSTGMSAPVRTSTDPRELAMILSLPQSVWAFATYHSLWALQRAHQERGGLSPFDLIVVDEAHHTAGAADKPWSVVNHDHNIPGRKRLYATATPRTAVGSGEHGDVVAMDDPAVYGREVYHLAVRKAIDVKVLADFRVAVPVVIAEPAARALDQDDDLIPDRKITPEMAAMAAALVDAHRQFGTSRVISFHSRVSDCHLFAGAVDAVARAAGLRVFAAPIDGSQSPAHRARLMNKLARENVDISLLANARVLGEGVDVPEVDGVLFAHRKTSSVDIVQAVGRALRAHKPGKIATVIIPVVVPANVSPSQAVDESACDRLWDTLVALKEHDSHLTEHLTFTSSQPYDPDRYAARVAAASSGSPGVIFYAADQALLDVLASGIRIRMLDLPGRVEWRRGYEAAVRYHSVHGHLDVPKGFTDEHGVRLYSWIRSRRDHYHEGIETAEQIRLLEELGIDWAPHETRWQEGLAAATNFREEHGHLRVAQSYAAADGFPLGIWLRERRSEYRKGILNVVRISALEKLGIDWILLDPQANWDENLAAATAYAAKHGNLMVPWQFVTDGGLRLGGWIAKQRDARKTGALDENRIRALDALGMVWDPIGDLWRSGLQHAEAYRTEYRTLEVPASYVCDDGYQLGQWIASQRRKVKKLSADQIAQLDALGMVWDPKGDRWRAALEHARAYRHEHGHLDVPSNYICTDGFRLGTWMAVQRRKIKNGERTELQLAGLREIGMAC